MTILCDYPKLWNFTQKHLMASKALTNQSLCSHSSSSLVTSITKILQSCKPNLFSTNIRMDIPSLSQFHPHLNANLVIQVINNQSNPYHALIFFKWASMHFSNRKFYFSFTCYAAMVDLLLSQRLTTTAIQLLETHKMMSDSMIARFIKAFGAQNDIRGAIGMFHRAKKEVKDGNCISSLNCLLGVLIRAYRFKLAFSIFNKEVDEGLVKLDVITYTTVIKGYCKVGKMEDACKLFDKMPCRPNNYTYGILVWGFCKKGMMVEARQMFDKMLMSKDCLPNSIEYSSLIDGYCKKGDMEKAMMCLDEMVEQGCEPNLSTYNTIVNGFFVLGKVDEAKKVMTKMRLDGVKDDVVTNTSLLRGFCVGGRYEEAVEHLKDMIRLGMKVDVQTYGLLVNNFCKLGKAKEAIALLRDMIERGIRPSVSSFNAVLEVLVGNGELNEAVVFLNWMRKMCGPPNFKSYMTVIYGLIKTGRRVQQVDELVNSMRQDGHKLDQNMYSSLVSMYTECGELEVASQVFDDSLRDRCLIKSESFAAFIEALCLKEKKYVAENHAQELLKRCPDTQVDEYQRVLKELKCIY